jgi:hypothetical protein
MEENGKYLLTESHLGKLYMYFEEYSGKNFLHIRYWFTDRKDGILKPGKKGIAIPENLVNPFLAGLKVLLQHNQQQAKQDAENVYG